MPTSPNFDDIKTWIDPTPLTFTADGYKKDGVTDDGVFRRMCPHILGYVKAGAPNEKPENDLLLRRQLEGPGHEDPTEPEWRCYKVEHLVNVQVDTATPWEMGDDYSKHHSCTKTEPHKVPFP